MFSSTSTFSTDSENKIEHALNNFSLALKSENYMLKYMLCLNLFKGFIKCAKYVAQ